MNTSRCALKTLRYIQHGILFLFSPHVHSNSAPRGLPTAAGRRSRPLVNVLTVFLGLRMYRVRNQRQVFFPSLSSDFPVIILWADQSDSRSGVDLCDSFHLSGRLSLYKCASINKLGRFLAVLIKCGEHIC